MGCYPDTDIDLMINQIYEFTVVQVSAVPLFSHRMAFFSNEFPVLDCISTRRTNEYIR